MLEYLLVAAAALLASGLTLISGFGLGTLLLPVMALLFPLQIAIAATALVHLANNLLKLALVGRHADRAVVARFGVAAGVAAIAGAASVGMLADLPALAAYSLLGAERQVDPLDLVIGLLIVSSALLELNPRFGKLSFDRIYLVPGGLLSGFFGGLSGNQGALRAAFLVRAGLGKLGFVGTSVVCSIIVDTVRILIYGLTFAAIDRSTLPDEVLPMVVTAVLAAFTGAVLGVRLLQKITWRSVQLTVAAMMIVAGLALAGGLL